MGIEGAVRVRHTERASGALMTKAHEFLFPQKETLASLVNPFNVDSGLHVERPWQGGRHGPVLVQESVSSALGRTVVSGLLTFGINPRPLWDVSRIKGYLQWFQKTKWLA